MSSQSWFGNGATSAPQDGSRPRETARSEDFERYLPTAPLREGSISVRLLCVMLFHRYLKFFLDLGAWSGGRNPYERRAAIVGTGEWDSSCGCHLRRHCNARGISIPGAPFSPASSSSARANQDAEEENAMKTRAAVALEKGSRSRSRKSSWRARKPPKCSSR